MMRLRVKRGSSVRRFIEYLLLLAGIVGVALWVASNVIPALWQRWDDRAFDRTDRNKPSGPSVPIIPANGLVGRLVIPRLNLRAIVREGVGGYTLGIAAGHIPGTAFPWQKGNVAVAGHRDTLFRGLGDIRKDDLIQFDTLNASYIYEVASTKIVEPEDVSVLKSGASSELTLVTCYPFNYIGSAPERFIVKAHRLSQVSAQNSLPEEPVQPAKRKATPRRIEFTVVRDHSRQLAPGISLGVSDTDVATQQMNGWMWIMADRRTVWLRDRGTGEPLVFYTFEEGKRRELVITKITSNSVTGYLGL
jgi:LPXTG-site transpeptidase (sortase) family protein